MIQKGVLVGFWRDKYVYQLSGNPGGQLWEEHVHRLSGLYIGELYKDMVVDKHLGNMGNIGDPGNSGNTGNPGDSGNRGGVNYGYPDVIFKLLKKVVVITEFRLWNSQEYSFYNLHIKFYV